MTSCERLEKPTRLATDGFLKAWLIPNLPLPLYMAQPHACAVSSSDLLAHALADLCVSVGGPSIPSSHKGLSGFYHRRTPVQHTYSTAHTDSWSVQPSQCFLYRRRRNCFFSFTGAWRCGLHALAFYSFVSTEQEEEEEWRHMLGKAVVHGSCARCAQKLARQT
jgi:hypothetical protein